MTDIYDDAQALEQAERDRLLAARVRFDDAALPPADRDCDKCELPIDTARLAALPGAVTCIDCAEAAERAARLSR